jgi:acyl-CoA thioester hydrolase
MRHEAAWYGDSHHNGSVLLPPSALPRAEAPVSRRAPPPRSAFRRFVPIAARWNDVDAFGHVNNAVFYAYFDTAVVRYLHEIGALGVRDGAQVAVVAASGASFFAEVLFADRIEVGLRVDRLGTSSITYGIGVFRNHEPRAAVAGHFTHVFVDRATRRPVPVAPAVRAAFERLRDPGMPE